jgi:hypothetical protein
MLLTVVIAAISAKPFLDPVPVFHVPDTAKY